MDSFLEKLISAVPHAIFWKDKNLVFQGCNNQFAKQFGYNHPSLIIGKSDHDFPFPPHLIKKYQQDDLDIMQSGVGKLNYEEVQVQDDGTERIVLVSKVPYKNEAGEIDGILGVYTDITERKEAEIKLQQAKEQSEAANRAKTEFLENMRHDIRTPLTGIIGFAEIIKMEANESLIREYADNLVASSLALLGLLDEVLEAIRISSGEIPRIKRKFDLHKTLQNVIDLNRAKAAEKNLNLSLDFDENIPQYVLGDKIRIHRIILELIANALNFTDYGFVKLTAQLAKRKNNQIILKFIVEDTGIGIPKEKQDEIYLQFKRLTPSYQGIYKGVGLGLAITKQFVDELEGEIYVESQAYKGTVFTCILPLQESLLDDDIGIDTNIETQLERHYQSTYAQPFTDNKKDLLKNYKHKILVVDDNIVAQKVAKAMLESLECCVDLAHTGKSAISLWENSQYDLILMDIGLPDLDGYEVVRHIRANEGKTRIPIIAVTSHGGDENKKQCFDAGMSAFVTKPLTTKSCKHILKSLLSTAKNENKHTIEYKGDLPSTQENLFALESFPLLDIESGIKITGSRSLLQSMLPLMVQESLTVDFHRMKEAYQAQDWEEIQSIAHKIKGGAVYLGTTRIKMACQYLERYWKIGGRELLDKLYHQAVTVIEESILSINDWLSTVRS